MRTTTKMMRSGTYGSLHKDEDVRLAQNCKSLPVPAFVSKTPRHQGLFSIVALSARPQVWKTAPRSQSFLISHTVVWEEGVVLCFVFRQRNGWLKYSLLPPHETFAMSM